MSPAPAMATRAFEVASSSVAGACFDAPGDEIAGRGVINRKAALQTSARIFRVMQKLLFIFSVRKIPRKRIRRLRCGATPGYDRARHTRYSRIYKDTRAKALDGWRTKSLREPQNHSLHLYSEE